jgi:hypothetical protein
MRSGSIHSMGIARAFHTALLLSGDTDTAERIVLSAVAVLCPQRLHAEALLVETIRRATRCHRAAVEETGAGDSDLPVELRNVLELDSALRRCFVVRTLLGFSLLDCAQLLRLEPEQVKTRTLAASEWLANRPQKQKRGLRAANGRRTFNPGGPAACATRTSLRCRSIQAH